MSRPVEHAEIKNLVPISSLTYENQAEILKHVTCQTLEAGKMLFKAGQVDKKTVYILEGELQLSDATGGMTIIKGQSPAALHPVANEQPRQFSAFAKSEIRYIAIDNDLMDVLLTWDQTASYVVTEIDDANEEEESDNDWMTSILRSEIFMRIPPANIQKMFMRMEQIPALKGEVIVSQGAKGDYYYILQKGECEVIRSSPDGKKKLRLAVLKAGDGFGEEALICDSVRNATVRMVSDGSLMRLSQKDFNELLKEPVIEQMEFEQAAKLVNEGSAVWLDVRVENEYKASNIKGSTNIPLYLLRLRASKLDPAKKYIIYCNSGSRSATAAYLLSERGFDIAVLVGGFMSVPNAVKAAAA